MSQEFIEAVKRLCDALPQSKYYFAYGELKQVRDLLEKQGDCQYAKDVGMTEHHCAVQCQYEKPIEVSELSMVQKLELSKKHQDVVAKLNLVLKACQATIIGLQEVEQRGKVWEDLGEVITQVCGPEFMWYRPNPFHQEARRSALEANGITEEELAESAHAHREAADLARGQ